MGPPEGRVGVQERDGGNLNEESGHIVDMVLRTRRSWRLTISTGCKGKKKSWH